MTPTQRLAEIRERADDQRQRPSREDVPFLLAEVERLREALEKLDAHLDFAEPFESGDLGIEDVTGINAALTEACAALSGTGTRGEEG